MPLLNSYNASNGNTNVAPAAKEAARDPNSSDNNYQVGQMWVNTASEEVFFLVAFNAGVPTWIGTSAGTGTFTSVSISPGPAEIHGILTIDGDIDTPGVITLNANAGPTETIVIQSTQGTGADAIEVTAISGGIQMYTQAAGKDVTIAANAGSVSVIAAEDIDEAIQIVANGGIASTVGVNNITGTAPAAPAPATAAIHIGSVLGGVGIIAGKDFNIQSDTDSIVQVATGDLDLIVDTGDLNLTASTGQLVVTAVGGIDYNITGSIDLDATNNSHFTVTGASKDLLLSSAGGSVNISADEAVVDAITINATAGGMEIGSDNMTLDATQFIANVTTNLGLGTAATITTVDMVNITPTLARTTTIAGGAVVSAIADTLNLATGGVNTNAGASKIVNVASGDNLLGTTTVNIGSGTAFTGTHTVNIASGAGGGTKTVQIGNADALTGISLDGVIALDGGATGAVSVNNVQVATDAAGPAATAAATNDARVGSVTFSGYTQAAAATMVLTLTNSFIAADSCVLATVTNTGANDAQMHVTRIFPGAGSAVITILNGGAAALNGDMQLNFWVLS